LLIRTLFALAFFTVVAETLLHGVHALAQSAVRRQSLLAARAEIGAATEAARAAAVQAIVRGGDPRGLNLAPLRTGGCRLLSGATCAIEGRATVTFTMPAPATPCPEAACTVYEQGNDHVDEGRLGASIVAQALGPEGAVLASRTQNVVFRTTRVSPYAALAGQSDATDIGSASPGDDAGAVPTGTAPGTLVDVIYRNAVTGAEIPANVWQAAAESRDGAAAWRP